MLQEAGVDLLEVSGGSYESPAMVGEMGGGKNTVAPKRASTLAREAYFLEFARTLRRKLSMPIMGEICGDHLWCLTSKFEEFGVVGGRRLDGLGDRGQIEAETRAATDVAVD